jgi:aldehyde:ferredoxin oxidoreductase
MEYFGYAGKIADIDLATCSVIPGELPEDLIRRYLGGIGFNAGILYHEIKPGTDPLGPENILVFSTGALVGTNVPTASRTEVSALSPATGLFGTTNSGNYWGGELKYAGYDALVIRGRSEKPVYIWICDGMVKIMPADHLWGTDAWDAIRKIREELGDPEIQVAVIGQAGENKVRFASIENGPCDAWARTGMGAVMGSKNLKAVAVRGTGAVRVARRRDFANALDNTRQAIEGSPFYGAFRKFGSMLASIPYYEFGCLPGRNFQTGTPDNWMESRTRKQLPAISKRAIGCIACNIACAHWVEVKEGPHAGLALKDMEVTPVIGFGAGCDIQGLPAIANISGVCQRYGMDMVSASACVAFAMELYQKNIIGEGDLGFKLSWGDEEGTLKLLEMIARRRGIGDILAEGIRLASAKFSGSESFAMHVKGLEYLLADPRARWSTWTFGCITNVRGGDHLRTRNPVENLRFNDNPIPYRSEIFGLPDQVYDGLDMPGNLKKDVFNPSSRDVNIPLMAKWSEDLISIYNAVGMCIRPPVLHTVGPTLFSSLISALSGLDISPEDITKAGERIWNTIKLFNLKHGERPEQSDFPPRFYREGVNGKKPLDPEAVRATLREYYTARGWDPETGVPTAEKCLALDLLTHS